MDFIEYPDAEMMYLALAKQIASELGAFLRRDGRASLCVPGGTTPGPVFDTLSGVDLDWPNVAVFLNDERWVPESSERSNTRLLRDRLLRGPAAKANLVPLYAPADQPEDMLDALSAGLAPHLPISVLLLGMGADMHTASLFPGADLLEQALASDAPILMALRAEAAGEPRITLSAPALKSAFHTHILIKGPEKRAALERAKTLPVSEAPVRAVLDVATVHWTE
ncbi:MAG: 6-phosphogluconolactonase [Pseudotabrizicola sp.]|uniref:6-phosphogluconolactonase n=1 Tax=Pseudotabrizicola sp. TaxID=2939647 RepID=UPI002727AF93|nr:6-phosphogluconolactonase [Pseudotabrizicola sp.]MDO8884150.1 6-phosphogluconolactonase [Pseudotabrizicola sp.]MDP2083194.1 6-phosphogluconolactonase [Pseudotabrizicola sp.]MDZ7572611.1 6-phosphogluconolactonase [Pseudotabrizicola sp.]